MFVYVITSTVDGRVYVGKSAMPANRWCSHKSASRRGAESPLYAAMREHGVDAFEFVVVEECASEAKSYDAEKRWIAKLNATDSECGFNRSLGGTGSAAAIKVAKRKRYSPEVVEQRAAANRGQKRTAEQRTNLAQSDHKYRHITPAMCWELYSQGLSTREVAKRLDVKSHRPIERLLKIGGYELRNPGRAKRGEVTAAECWALYSQGKSLQAVADALGCNPMLVFRRLRKAGFQLRDAVESHLRLVV